jgi:hypothetical protein
MLDYRLRVELMFGFQNPFYDHPPGADQLFPVSYRHHMAGGTRPVVLALRRASDVVDQKPAGPRSLIVRDQPGPRRLSLSTRSVTS